MLVAATLLDHKPTANLLITGDVVALREPRYTKSSGDFERHGLIEYY